MSTRKETVYLLRNVQMDYESVATRDLSVGHYGGEYIRLGQGEVEFTMASDDEQIASAVTALEAAKQKEMADSQMRLKAFDERIQSLLAITHAPA